MRCRRRGRRRSRCRCRSRGGCRSRLRGAWTGWRRGRRARLRAGGYGRTRPSLFRHLDARPVLAPQGNVLLRPGLSRGFALRRGSALGPAFGSAFGPCRLPGGYSAARRRRRFAGINLRDKLERLADRLVLGERNVGAKDGRHNARCRNHGAGDAITKHVASLRYSTARANPSGPERNDLKVTQMRSFWRKARTKIRVVNTLRFPPRFLAAALLKLP